MCEEREAHIQANEASQKGLGIRIDMPSRDVRGRLTHIVIMRDFRMYYPKRWVNCILRKNQTRTS